MRGGKSEKEGALKIENWRRSKFANGGTRRFEANLQFSIFNLQFSIPRSPHRVLGSSSLAHVVGDIIVLGVQLNG